PSAQNCAAAPAAPSRHFRCQRTRSGLIISPLACQSMVSVAGPPSSASTSASVMPGRTGARDAHPLGLLELGNRGILAQGYLLAVRDAHISASGPNSGGTGVSPVLDSRDGCPTGFGPLALSGPRTLQA